VPSTAPDALFLHLVRQDVVQDVVDEGTEERRCAHQRQDLYGVHDGEWLPLMVADHAVILQRLRLHRVLPFVGHQQPQSASGLDLGGQRADLSKHGRAVVKNLFADEPVLLELEDCDDRKLDAATGGRDALPFPVVGARD
jgi:hypothetical protein